MFSLMPLPTRQFFSVVALATVAGFTAPLLYCKRRRARNQAQITQSLPDMLDLMLVCSEAGLGLEMSIARVSEEIAPTWPLLAGHLDHIGRELRTGRSKLDALKGLADRTGTKETVSLVRLLVQSDALGTSVATTLRIYAEEMRAHRMLAAEEMAHKISAKLSLVLVGCFLPAVLIAVIAPVIFTIVHTWSGLHL
jgi:tight adherence protein C